jgi:hypothetical protein
MAKKYKLTGCAKFFIFFIIAAPLAYIGASYYNGQDPIKKIKEYIPMTFSSSDEDKSDKNIKGTPTKNSQGSVYQEMELKDLEIKTLNNDLEDCKKLGEKQKQLIETQKLEIKNLKQQLQGN